MTKPWSSEAVEARGVADGTVDVGDGAARAAHDVVVVVADAHLVAGDGPGRLDPAHEAGLGEGTEDVVDRLVRHVTGAPRAPG